MNHSLGDTAYRLMLDLVAMPSVSPSATSEGQIAEFIFNTLKQERYFQEHPEDLRYLPCRNDPLQRRSVFAIVRSPKPTGRTVLLMSHMDVVDADVYGPLKKYAFDPERLTREIGNTALPDHVRADLDSGEWLFGRGVSDMKSSVAIELAYLITAAENLDSLETNLAVLIVPDEENNSQGMIDSVPYLRRMQEDEGLQFLTCINMEPTVGSAENAGPTIYMGSIGKINPFFYCLGRETHVGEYYQGLSAAPMISTINLMLDGNAAYTDTFNGVAYLPWGCMRQLDLREEYSASIMFKAVAFYSYLTVTKFPGEILGEMREIAKQAIKDTLARHRGFAEQFARSRGTSAGDPGWSGTVLSFRELCDYVRENTDISISELAKQVSTDAPETFDERDKAFRLVDKLVDACGLRGPLIVLGFLPPYYPHRGNAGERPEERALQNAIRSVVEAAVAQHDTTVTPVDFFEGVSDLSYCGFDGGPEALEPIAENLPGWGVYYTFPIDDLAAIRIPIVNIGPVGRDAHKVTERIHVPYAFNVLPSMIDIAVRRIGRTL